MDRGEVLDWLESASLWLPLVPGTEIPERVAIKAAIALLTPEPVTEEGLRAEGFDRHDTPFGDNWILRVQDDLGITFFQRRWVLAEFEGGEYDLHIESMQQLREVIKALRGLTNESEASE